MKTKKIIDLTIDYLETLDDKILELGRFLVNSTLDEQCVAQCKKILHSIKGTSGMFGLTEISTTAKEIEQKIINDESKFVSGELEEFCREKLLELKNLAVDKLEETKNKKSEEQEEVEEIKERGNDILRVHYIEDEDLVIRLARKAVEKIPNLEFSFSKSVDDLRNVGHHLKIDIIITDHHLGDETSENVVEIIKNTPNLKKVPVILLSGEQFEGSQKENFEKVFSAIWVKPIKFNQLESMLRKLM